MIQQTYTLYDYNYNTYMCHCTVTILINSNDHSVISRILKSGNFCPENISQKRIKKLNETNQSSLLRELVHFFLKLLKPRASPRFIRPRLSYFSTNFPHFVWTAAKFIRIKLPAGNFTMVN